MSLYNLDHIFQPESVAVIGASEKKGTIGRALIENLVQAEYPGDIYPINPKYDSLFGHPAYGKITETPTPVDLAVIAVPLAKVPPVIGQCVKTGVKGTIIISAGGKETGSKGRKLEEKIKQKAEKGGLRIIGPNCMGIICPAHHLNASFAAHMPSAGSLAFISQSGAICSAMLDLSLQERMGFRHFISIGSMLDVDFGDLLDYVGSDPQVKSVLLYIESLTHFRKFMSAARAVSRMKPVIVLKSGRSAIGVKAAASHTGAMAGEDHIYDAAFQRAGTVRVNTLKEFFNCAELLAKQSRPSGKRVTIVSNSGGPAVMAIDTIEHYQLQPGSLNEATIEKLDAILPSPWSRGNPIDILGDATAERYAKVVECLDPADIDGLLVILNPQAMTDPAEVAEALIKALENKSYIAFACWMGGRDVEQGIEILNDAGIPTYDTPEQAIKSFMYLYHYAENLKLLQEIPPKMTRELRFDHATARELVDTGCQRENGLLAELESKRLLAAYSIPVNRTEPAASLEEARKIARSLGYPLAMKISSLDISHKSEADGVQLDIRTDSDVQAAFEKIMRGAARHNPEAHINGVTLQPMSRRPDAELLLGAKKDPDFGPVILFGMGGIYAEIIEDLAERMKWVEEIGHLKQQHGIPVLQITRWENLLEDHIGRARKAGLDTDFIKAVFETIHAQAIKRQL
jgi:acetyltransferase